MRPTGVGAAFSGLNVGAKRAPAVEHQGPDYEMYRVPPGGPGEMPLALRLSEGIGVNAVRLQAKFNRVHCLPLFIGVDRQSELN